jgi:Flp pilus assembly protein TadB
MGDKAALFLFLAAASVAGFVFLSIAVWVNSQVSERKARDRYSLLKALTENPSENAQRVLAYLREDEESRRARKREEDRKGYLMAGLICMAVGIGLGVLHAKLFGIALMLVLIGVAFLPFGIEWKLSGRQDGPGR